MFRKARWRLTLLYIVLFAMALGVFAAVFYVGFATVLAPDFDIEPELTNAQVADAAPDHRSAAPCLHGRAIDRVAGPTRPLVGSYGGDDRRDRGRLPGRTPAGSRPGAGPGSVSGL